MPGRSEVDESASVTMGGGAVFSIVDENCSARVEDY